MKKKAEERPATRPLDQALIQDLPQGAPGHDWGSEGAPGIGRGWARGWQCPGRTRLLCCGEPLPETHPSRSGGTCSRWSEFKPTQNQAGRQSRGTVLSTPTLTAMLLYASGLEATARAARDRVTGSSGGGSRGSTFYTAIDREPRAPATTSAINQGASKAQQCAGRHRGGGWARGASGLQLCSCPPPPGPHCHPTFCHLPSGSKLIAQSRQQRY